MTDFEPEAINAALSIIINGIGMTTILKSPTSSRELYGKAEDVINKLFDDFLDGDHEVEAEDNPGASNGLF